MNRITITLLLIVIKFDAIAQNLYSSDPEIKTNGEVRVINGVSVPSDFPKFDINVLKETAPGKIFLSNYRGGYRYFMILENDGTPYFYQRTPSDVWDFKLQPTGTLTRWQHIIGCVEMDSSYTIIKNYKCGNGYDTDSHEVQLLPNGHVLLIGRDPQIVDMSQIVEGGDSSATVLGYLVQELDQNDNVIFEWLSWDHFEIRDAIHLNLTDSYIDYVHMNALAIDYDGHILISSKHLSEVTKINRQSGDIIWRLGGVNNQFDFVNDEYGISYQHDIRPVPGKINHYTLFDNGNFHSPQFSRAVEFKLDTTEMTATNVWEYRHTPDRYARQMGNVQRLPNGNTLICWSRPHLPKITEVTHEGEIVYEMNFAEEFETYRAFRFDWESPMKVPYLIGESLLNKVSLIYNKFGDKDVKYYIIYGGLNPNPIVPIDTTFSTFLELDELENNQRYYFRVTAVNFTEEESEFSNEIEIFTNFVNPGDNLVINSNFSDSTNHWDFQSKESSDAHGDIEAGIYQIKIDQGGSDIRNVQLNQGGLEMIQGNRYLFEFDGYSDSTRTITAEIEMSVDPFTNYSKIGYSLLSPINQRYSYEFEMEHSTDYRAQLVFNCGLSSADVHLDNISIRQVGSSSLIEDINNPPAGYHLYQNYPNPFNPSTNIRFSLAKNTKVTIEVFNIIGQRIKILLNKYMTAGNHEVQFNANNLPSGIYFYRIQLGDQAGRASEFQDVKKMILLR